MADKIYDVGRFRHSIDNWQLSMLLGIIFFIVGIVVFFEPGGTYLALSVLFGIVVILSGAFELYLALFGRSRSSIPFSSGKRRFPPEHAAPTSGPPLPALFKKLEKTLPPLPGNAPVREQIILPYPP